MNQYHIKKTRNLISEKYILAGIYLSSGEKEKSKKLFEEIILSDDKFYTSLALYSILEKKLEKHNRDPHSVIGSSCIGASRVGGVCNNSGGALVQRGPAYTELSLYAKINSDQKLELVNDLGIDLGKSPEEILSNLENKNFNSLDIDSGNKRASDNEYKTRIRDVNASSPARFNGTQDDCMVLPAAQERSLSLR